MYPTFDKIREMAAGDYKRIPICKELYADSYTPVEMMRILQKASHHCYLLESASQSEAWGRYSFLGYDPSMEITCTDGILRIRKTSKTETFGRSGTAAESSTESSTEEVRQVAHPGDAIREIISQYKSPVMDDMPTFTGGLVGYFSYDYIKYSEPKLELKDKEQQDFRDLDLMLFNDVIAFDHYRQKVLLITGVMTEDLEKSYKQACEKLEEMTALIKKGEKKIFPPIRLKSEIQPQFPKEKYCQMVETAKHYIHEGDIFQVVLSNPMTAAAEGAGATLDSVYEVLVGGENAGYAIKVVASGSQGSIEMMVGVDGEGAVTGVSIVSHSETSGIGTKVMGNEATASGVGVLDQFQGKSAADGTLAVGSNVDAITGATVSTRGVTTGVNAALAVAGAMG